MSFRKRFKNLKGQAKDAAQLFSGSGAAQSTSSLPNSTPSVSPMPESLALPAVSITRPISAPPDGGQVVVDNSFLLIDPPPDISPMPESLALPTEPISQPVSAPSSGGQKATGNSWTALRGSLRVLTKTSNVFGLLGTAMEDLDRGIAFHEDARAARQDYETLKSELEALLSTLSGHFASAAPPTMTASMDNLCSAIEKELAWISSKKERGTARRHLEAKKDLDEVVECYRRIQGHLDRLILNANLKMWTIVDELAIEARLSKLQPSMSACYDSAEADQLRRRECTPQTRGEVLAELGTWTHDREQGNIYWLNGMAGTGKTTIATSLCAMLGWNLGASFFCTRQLPECRDVKRIIPTIAYQLASFSRPFRWALSRVLERNPDIGSKALPIQLQGLIIDPLSEVAQTLPTDLVVVIDALDECDDSDGVERILNMLVKHAPQLPLKVFVSSRPEPQIRKKIGSMKSQLVLHELDDQIVKGDIETYLRAELEGISVSEAQLSALIDQAGVLFIYAATVVRYIQAEDFHLGQQKRLDAVLASSTTSFNQNKDIDALYSVVLASAFSNPKLEDLDKERMRLVLWTVVCAREPLTVDALAGLLQLGDAEWVRAALRPLWSVLQISLANGLVNTLHASFPDFMLNLQRSQGHACDAQAHHGRLAELSLARIQNNKRQFNICELESSYVFDEQVPNLDDRVKRAIPSDLAYACQYWAVHLERAEWSDKRMELLHEFLSVRLFLWMEVLNLRKRINIGPGLLSKARKWCMGQGGTSDTKDLVHDAWRFVTTFAANPVSRSTPHIYVSMLAFWPNSRPVREQYLPRTSCLVDVAGTAMARRELVLLNTITTESQVSSVAFSPDGLCIISGSLDKTIRVWDGQSGQMVLGPLEGHTKSVNSVAFLPDGMRIVSGSEDKTIRVWDGQSGQMVLGPLEGHTKSVNSVAFSPDGMRIVSGSFDKTIRVWDGQSGQMVLGPLEGHTDPVYSVAFSPDGMRIVSGSRDKTIRVWDGQSGQMVLGPLEGHTRSVNSVAFSPDSMRIVSGSDDNTIRVWDGQSRQMVLGPLEGHTGRVGSVAFSPDGIRIISGSSDNTIRVWDGQSGQMVLGPLEGHTESVNSVAFSPDGMRIVSASDDKTIRVWDGQSGQVVLGPLEGHAYSVNSVAFLSDSMHLVSGSSDNTIWVGDGQSGQMVLAPLEGHAESVNSVAFSPDSMRIISGSPDDTIWVWDGQSGQMVLAPLEGHTESVNSVAFSPDGMRIVSGSEDDTIRVWDGQSGQMVLGPLEGHTDSVLSVAFSPDGIRIVSGSSDDTIWVWDGRSGQMVLGPLEGHTRSVNSVAFSPDGMRIVSGSEDDTIRVWDGQSGQMVLGPFEGHTWSVKSAAFSPDGTRIVSGSGDKTIRVWDGQSGQMVLGPLEGHTKSVNSVAFSPDGMRIVSGSFDKTIRVWDGQSGQMVLGPLEGHTDPVYSVAFSPDGMRIVSGSRDKTIRVWDGQSGQMVLGPLEGHTRSVNSVAFSPDSMRIVSGSDDNTIRVWDGQSRQMVLGPLRGHTDPLSPATSLPSCITDHPWEAPHSSTPAHHVCAMPPSLNSMSQFVAPSPWRLNMEGWVIDQHWRILLWVPLDLCDRVLVPPNVLILSGRGSVWLDFDRAKIGESWVECYLPA